MPITTRTTPASRTLAQWGKLTASQTRVIRFLLVNHFIECPQELIDLGIKHQTLKSLRFMRLLDAVPSRSHPPLAALDLLVCPHETSMPVDLHQALRTALVSDCSGSA